MDEVKRVKVDNWGIYFLQRLKHFFNRTDFCDLTLQFQDKAQLKVHRLVLSACTEYFEVLERTCEMYDDSLVMPDDLQADVVVPIVNFMYTGNLEFKMDLLERLYITSQVMRMPVLTKLLEAHRVPTLNLKPATLPKSYSKSTNKLSASAAASTSVSTPIKRSYSRAFENNVSNTLSVPGSMPLKLTSNVYAPNKNTKKLAEPKPTRYEIPEELESDVDESFSSISYESKPLMVHLGNNKNSQTKKRKLMGISNAKEILHGTSTVKIIDNIGSNKSCSIFDDSPDFADKTDLFSTSNVRNNPQRSTGHLFDQILENPINEPLDISKVTLETCDDTKQASNLDHAKIISEVLKKYPHLVKSNKNIKLKILNTGKTTKVPLQQSKVKKSEPLQIEYDSNLHKPDYVETDILDAKKAAKLISLGAMNIKGPWVCLMCGTPEKAIRFKSYYTFRRHLVEVHNEKPILKICEYCGMNTPKRNYLFHHLLTKHGIEPPPTYNFPKCNMCDYIGLTETLLVKHKVSHSEPTNFKCNVCAYSFSNSSSLLLHIQKTGHKYTSEKKNDLQCIYCLRVFTRKANLYAHIKTNHKQLAKLDGIIDDSDEDVTQDVIVKSEPRQNPMLYEYCVNYEQSIQNIKEQNQKILNSEFPTVESTKLIQKPKVVKQILNKQPEVLHNQYSGNMPEDNLVVTIDGQDYVVKNNQFIQQPKSTVSEEFVNLNYTQPNATAANSTVQTLSTSVEFESKNETRYAETVPGKLTRKISQHIEQPIQIVVSNDEEYKALMATNHSIIFNDVDNNKTLTVLTTAQNTDLNNTIDMDVTQSNEMMALPGNYPVDVSSSVTSNSNIVVVYSHAQEGSAEFVQTTAVHYETISPSNEIINTGVMQQHPESWQNEIPDNSDLQTVNVPISYIDQNSIVQERELEDLPNVQLSNQTEMSQTYTQEVILSTNYSDEGEHVDTNSAVQDLTENIIEEEVGSVPIIPMEVVIPAELQTAQECNSTELITSSGIQECANMPQIEEDAISACEDSQQQQIHNIHDDETETTAHIVEISGTIQENNLGLLEHNDVPDNEINVLHGTVDQLDNAPGDTLHNVEGCNDSNIIQGPQLVCEDASNDTYQIVSKDQLDLVVDPNLESPTQSHEDLQDSGENSKKDSHHLHQELIQTLQCDFEPSQQLHDSIEVSETAEIDESNVIILSNLVNVQEVSSSQFIEDKDCTDNEVEMVEIQHSPEKIPEVVKEKIQSITSEWSEDELETSKRQEELNDNEVEAHTLEESTLSVSNITMDTDDVEESIENIQQEMEKQMAESETESLLCLNNKIGKNISQEVEEIPTGSEGIPNKRMAQPEQISSLLNEWEENEELKEDIDTNEEIQSIASTTMSESAPVLPEGQNKPSDDKIQSLVSDWDDEEENRA